MISISRATTLTAGLAAAAGAAHLGRRVLQTEEATEWPATGPLVGPAGAAQATAEFGRTARGPHEVGLAYAPSRAATIEPYAEGAVFYPLMLDDIASATSSIHILMFGWKPGTVGSAFAELLLDRLRAGVAVRILVDSFGSRPYGTSRPMFTELVEAGATVVVNDLLPPDRRGAYPDASATWPISTIGRADHRKLFVIDGRVTWTGGAGIEDHFENGEFHDVMVRLTGDIVRQAQCVFLTSFSGQGGRLPDDLDAEFPTPATPGEIPAALGQVVPGGHLSATQAARELVGTAEERLDIMNPYLTDSDMIRRIVDASRRGVRVRLVVSKTSNNVLATAALRHHYGPLIDAGVEVWEYPGAVVHAKIIVADNSVQFGTLNLDAWALYRNFEFAVVAQSADLADAFEHRVFGPDIERSNAGRAPAGFGERLASAAANRLGYFL
jgi:cardiolipin synthase